MLCEMAAYEKDKGNSLYDKLIELYVQYGFYKESLISITKKGMNGQKEKADMMSAYRRNPPAPINGSPDVHLLTYTSTTGKNLQPGNPYPFHLPMPTAR